MYLTTKPGILKLVTIVMGLVVTIVGCNAHFRSPVKDALNAVNFGDACDLMGLKNCPTGAMAMEKFFVAISIICLILSSLSLLAGFLVDTSAKTIKLVDTGYHALAGIFVLIAGVLMLVSAFKIDKFMKELLELVGTGGGGIIPLESQSQLSVFSRVINSYQSSGSDSFVNDAMKEMRKEAKYGDKIAAGVLGILNAFIYLATGVFINRAK